MKGRAPISQASRKAPWQAFGCIEIDPNVVAIIAGMAVRETDGVAQIASARGMDDLRVRLEATTNSGVEGTRAATVDVAIVCEYGTQIPVVADAIRRNVATRLAEMTGILVVEVNIDVMNINFEQLQ